MSGGGGGGGVAVEWCNRRGQWRRRGAMSLLVSTVLLLALLCLLLNDQRTLSQSDGSYVPHNERHYVSEISAETPAEKDSGEWRAGTTVRYPADDHGKAVGSRAAAAGATPFDQPLMLWLRVNEGSDVELPCRLSLARLGNARHSMVAWYRGVLSGGSRLDSPITRELLSLGAWPVTSDYRVSVQLRRDTNSWSLLLRRVSRDDADEYGCFLSGGTGDDIARVVLDVVPWLGRQPAAADSVGVYPWRKALTYRYTSGFHRTTADAVGRQTCGGNGTGGAVHALTAVLVDGADRQRRDKLRQMWRDTLPPPPPPPPSSDSSEESGSAAPLWPLAFVVHDCSDDDAVAQSLTNESTVHGDLVLGKCYVNSRVKHLLEATERPLETVLRTMVAFEFFNKYCNNARHLLVIDGTVHDSVNASAVTESVGQTAVLTSHAPAPAMAVYGRHLAAASATNRNPLLPHYVPYSDYFSDVLPAYVSGDVYLYTGASVESLYERALRRPSMAWPELFFNGLVAEEAAVARHQLSSLDRVVSAAAVSS